MRKALVVLVLALAVFLGYVSTRKGDFLYERSGVINAPAEKVFPYISYFKAGSQWSPYEQKDPAMKKSIAGTDGQPGAVMEFDGNSDVGSGRLELVALVPNQSVELRLILTKPMAGENKILYRLTPEGKATRFSWSLSGNGGFLVKLMSVFLDCEKMFTADVEKGIANLKALAEARP